MSRKIRIVPAILTDDPATLEKLVRQTERFTDYAQFDIMDGKFVPSNSVTCAHITAVKPKLKWEVHLMVLQPEDYIEDYKKAGAVKVNFHFEAAADPLKVIRKIKALDMKVGLAINPETPVGVFAYLVKEVDSVLFLAVHPGFYGAKIVPEVLDKVAIFRTMYPKTETGIDGGVKESNIREIARGGVNVVYVGSAISLAPDPAAAYKKLKALAQGKS